MSLWGDSVCNANLALILFAIFTKEDEQLYGQFFEKKNLQMNKAAKNLSYHVCLDILCISSQSTINMASCIKVPVRNLSKSCYSVQWLSKRIMNLFFPDAFDQKSDSVSVARLHRTSLKNSLSRVSTATKRGRHLIQLGLFPTVQGLG